jgi:hypothetical protein
MRCTSSYSSPQSTTDGRPRGGGLRLLTDLARGEALQAIWWETADFRSQLHRLYRVQRCDTVFTWRGLRLGRLPSTPVAGGGPVVLLGSCPCRDLLADLIVEADRFLAVRRPHNPAGAVRAHLRIRAIKDWIREGRVARGAQARTDRVRTSEVGRRLPDDFHRAVLECLVDEAGVPAPLEHEAQLVGRIATRLSAEVDGSRDQLPQAVRAALGRVEAACRAGRRVQRDGELITWWECYVERPLGRRSRRSDLRLGAAGVDAPGVREVACPSAEAAFDEMMDTTVHGPGGADAVVVQAVLVAVTDDALPHRALVVAVRALEAGGVLPPGTTHALLRQPTRILAALAAASDVRAGAVLCDASAR